MLVKFIVKLWIFFLVNWKSLVATCRSRMLRLSGDLYMTYSGCWVPAGRFPNKVAPNVSDNMLRNPYFCYFTSFLIVSLAAFVNKLRESHFLRDLIILMITSISSFKFINVSIFDTIFFWITTSNADAAAFMLHF